MKMRWPSFFKKKQRPVIPTVEAEPERRVVNGIVQEKRLLEGFGEVWVTIQPENQDG